MLVQHLRDNKMDLFTQNWLRRDIGLSHSLNPRKRSTSLDDGLNTLIIEGVALGVSAGTFSVWPIWCTLVERRAGYQNVVRLKPRLCRGFSALRRPETKTMNVPPDFLQ